MTNSIHYFAIQDINAGYIQYLTDAVDEDHAIEKMKNDLGELNENELEITELTGDQYDSLVECTDGRDQDYIDILESYK